MSKEQIGWVSVDGGEFCETVLWQREPHADRDGDFMPYGDNPPGVICNLSSNTYVNRCGSTFLKGTCIKVIYSKNDNDEYQIRLYEEPWQVGWLSRNNNAYGDDDIVTLCRREAKSDACGDFWLTEQNSGEYIADWHERTFEQTIARPPERGTCVKVLYTKVGDEITAIKLYDERDEVMSTKFELVAGDVENAKPLLRC